MPKCANTDKQKISQYQWLPISEPIISATLIYTCLLDTVADYMTLAHTYTCVLVIR